MTPGIKGTVPRKDGQPFFVDVLRVDPQELVDRKDEVKWLRYPVYCIHTTSLEDIVATLLVLRIPAEQASAFAKWRRDTRSDMRDRVRKLLGPMVSLEEASKRFIPMLVQKLIMGDPSAYPTLASLLDDNAGLVVAIDATNEGLVADHVIARVEIPEENEERTDLIALQAASENVLEWMQNIVSDDKPN